MWSEIGNKMCIKVKRSITDITYLACCFCNTQGYGEWALQDQSLCSQILLSIEIQVNVLRYVQGDEISLIY